MDDLVQSSNLYGYVEITHLRKRIVCRNYFRLHTIVTFYYEHSMQFLRGIKIKPCRGPNHRVHLRHYNRFIRYMNRCGAQVIYMNTNFNANMELGNLLRVTERKKEPVLIIREQVSSLVLYEGKYLLITHKCKDGILNHVLQRVFEFKPTPVPVSQYRPTCTHKPCRSDDMIRIQCKLNRCVCRNRGFILKCRDCRTMSHICYMGCGEVVSINAIALHVRRAHQNVQYRVFSNEIFGDKRVENEMDYIIVDTEPL